MVGIGADPLDAEEQNVLQGVNIGDPQRDRIEAHRFGLAISPFQCSRPG